MLPRSSALFAVLFLVHLGSLRGQDQPTPQVDGYVTRVGTPEDFDVSGVHVLCRPASSSHAKNTLDPVQSCVAHVYGEHLFLFGHLDKKSRTLYPTEVRSPDRPAGQTVSGFAVLDKVLAPDMLRADGHAIHLNATHIVKDPPLTANDQPEPGQWISYTGKRTATGAILASMAEFLAPGVTPSEQKLLNKSNFDPSSVTEDDRQGKASKFFRGVDYKRIPASHDEVLQRRVTGIGERLIPAVQKQLSDGNPSRIAFRFQVVESDWRDAVTLPNGIIQVPRPLATNLPDDQLAAVLADNIATALEKQTYRSLPGVHARSATNIAGTVGGFLVPGLGIATSIGTGVAAHNAEKHMEEQSGRNALVLLHDAGFDIQQAPVAWWRLSTRKPDFEREKVPYRAAYLFQTLATEWIAESPLVQPPAARASVHKPD